MPVEPVASWISGQRCTPRGRVLDHGREVMTVEQSERRGAEQADLPEHERDAQRGEGDSPSLRILDRRLLRVAWHAEAVTSRLAGSKGVTARSAAGP